MGVKLLTGQHLEFLSQKGGCTGLSESTLVKCHIVGNHMSRLNYINCLTGYEPPEVATNQTDHVVVFPQQTRTIMTGGCINCNVSVVCNKLTVMCMTHGERRSKKQHFNLKSVCSALTAVRLKKGHASLVINCSCSYTIC